MLVSKGLWIWLTLGSLIVFTDAFFVLMRPLSQQKGTPLGDFYAYYDLYIKMDQLYGIQNNFLYIVAWLNIIEGVICFVGAFLMLAKCPIKQLIGAFFAIIANAFIFWKTVIYMWYDLEFVTDAVKSLTIESTYLYFIPNGFWIVCPILVMYTVPGRIIQFCKNYPTKQK